MAAAPARILIVEDTPAQAELALVLLRGLGHDLRVAETGMVALQVAEAWLPDAILMDLELPDFSGFEVMRRLRSRGVEAGIIVITAFGSVNHAVEAMREGAVDFLVKPFAKARLTVTIQNVLEKRALATELREVKAKLNRGQFFGFIGESASMQAVYRTIESVAPSRANVFITGESGTGKELAAEAVHRASARRNKPFIALNCGAIPRDLLESELFGHVKGAFTGATETRAGAAKLADGGTLFLDEIGDMPLEMQVKLLRFVQTGTLQAVGASRQEQVDVRIVSATNRNPGGEVQAGRFREDLYYRLYVVPIELPPLRERGEDKLLLASHFLTAFAQEERKQFRSLSLDAREAIASYSWPGNVRQLENVMRNVVVLHAGTSVQRSMLPPMLLRTQSDTTPVPASVDVLKTERFGESGISSSGTSLNALEALAESEVKPLRAVQGDLPESFISLAEMERRHILAALDHSGQDVPRAASLLGINASTIYRKLQAWRVETRPNGTSLPHKVLR